MLIRDYEQRLLLSINWQIYTYLPPDLIQCQCAELYWSHTQMVAKAKGDLNLFGRVVAEKPCPRCKRHTGERRYKSATTAYEVGIKEIRLLPS